MQKLKQYLGSQKTTNMLLIILIIVLMAGFCKMARMHKKMYRFQNKGTMMQMHRNMNSYMPQYDTRMYREMMPTEESYTDTVPPMMIQ